MVSCCWGHIRQHKHQHKFSHSKRKKERKKEKKRKEHIDIEKLSYVNCSSKFVWGDGYHHMGRDWKFYEVFKGIPDN